MARKSAKAKIEAQFPEKLYSIDGMYCCSVEEVVEAFRDVDLQGIPVAVYTRSFVTKVSVETCLKRLDNGKPLE